jgi:multiple sugar transport system permease protein
MAVEGQRKSAPGKWILYAVLIFFAFVMVLPFYWTILTSVRHNEDMFSVPIRWFSTNFTFEHYVEAFTTVPFGRYFANSFYLAMMGVLSNLFFGSLAGYAFAKLKFRGKGLIFKVLLSSLMVPGIVIMIPQFLLLRQFPLVGGNNLLGQGGKGFLNSYWAIILPGAAGAFAIFLMRQFFLTLPDDLAEAARIEGAGEFRIFWNIYLPLTKPALAALSIFTFQAGWNNFMWPMIILNNPDMFTVQLGLQAFSYNHATEYGPMMAASVVATVPIIALFIFAQKYFVQGISFSGIKG